MHASQQPGQGNGIQHSRKWCKMYQNSLHYDNKCRHKFNRSKDAIIHHHNNVMEED